MENGSTLNEWESTYVRRREEEGEVEGVGFDTSLPGRSRSASVALNNHWSRGALLRSFAHNACTWNTHEHKK